MRSTGDGKGISLSPPLVMTLERSLEYTAPDEYVEVTPKSLRLRKKNPERQPAQTRGAEDRLGRFAAILVRRFWSGGEFAHAPLDKTQRGLLCRLAAFDQRFDLPMKAFSAAFCAWLLLWLHRAR